MTMSLMPNQTIYVLPCTVLQGQAAPGTWRPPTQKYSATWLYGTDHMPQFGNHPDKQSHRKRNGKYCRLMLTPKQSSLINARAPNHPPLPQHIMNAYTLITMSSVITNPTVSSTRTSCFSHFTCCTTHTLPACTPSPRAHTAAASPPAGTAPRVPTAGGPQPPPCL